MVKMIKGSRKRKRVTKRNKRYMKKSRRFNSRGG